MQVRKVERQTMTPLNKPSKPLTRVILTVQGAAIFGACYILHGLNGLSVLAGTLLCIAFALQDAIS